MSYDYPDDGHIYVCVRVRDVATVPGMAVGVGASAIPSARRSTRETREHIRDAQRICVSTLENILILHDPKAVDDPSCVARDADSVVQLLTTRATGKSDLHRARKLLTSTSTASYFEFDRCLNSMDAASMMRMPLIRHSDFLRPPEYGSQEDVYRCTAAHAVSAAVEGINSCVFAYGQTGSGKTYTLFGDTLCLRRDPGVVPRTLDDLFQRLEGLKREYAADAETAYSCRVMVSFFEIYQNEVYCLLSRKGPLRVNFSRDVSGKKETMVIHDLQQHVVASADKVYPLVEVGLRRRQTGETGMNARSSRSHAILQVRVTQWRTNRGTKEAVEHNATINLVDLAGSERQKTAKTDGKSRDEGIQINQSLATLARVINDISRGAKYVNYRDSLLTMVLKDNLGGNSKTFMIANIAPVTFCFQESCATLQYARDVRKIRNRPVVNKTFQTRSNLLELNARLKQENDHLKQHIERLLGDIHQDQNAAGENGDDEDTFDSDEVPMFGIKAKRTAWGCGGHKLHAKADAIQAAATATVTEAVLSAASVAGTTAPLVVTAHRTYQSVDGIGSSYVRGGHVGVTSLAKDITRFRLDDLTGKSTADSNLDTTRLTTTTTTKDAVSTPTTVAAAARISFHDASDTSDCGLVEFERVSQRTCEQHYWVRFIPPTSYDVTSGVDCQINGSSLVDGDRRQLAHGDVLCVYLDGSGSEQSLVTFHYVDVNCLSRRGGPTNTTGELTVSLSLPGTPRDDDVAQLRRENAKLLDMIKAQARTIEYQCQREAESRSRLDSVANPHCRTLEGTLRSHKEDSPSPNPVQPDRHKTAVDVPAMTPLQVSAAARTFHRSSVSPSIRGNSLHATTADLLERAASSVSQRFDDCVRENQSLYKGMMERNATLEELARRLAELEKSTSPQRNGPAPTAPTMGPRLTANNKSAAETGSSTASSASRTTFEEEEQEESEDHEDDKHQEVTYESTESDNDNDDDDDDDEVRKGHASQAVGLEESAKTKNTQEKENHDSHAPSADEILRNHRANPDLGDLGRLHVYLSTSDGVREKYQGAQRERVLCERIWSLEQSLDDMQGEVELLESKLRIAQDNTTENELRQGQMEDEMTEVSKALLDATEENAALLRDIASLETLLSHTEEALAAASSVNEAELEKRLVIMAHEIKALRTLARMWKRRAMQRIAFECSGGAGNGNTDAATMERMLTGQVPWDDLRVESNAARAKKLLGERGCTAAAIRTIERFEKDTAIESVVALETILAELENENLRLMDDLKTYEQELCKYKDLVSRLRGEKEQLERRAAAANSSVEETERLKALYNSKCAELEQAERQCEAVAAKLQSTVQKTTAVTKRSVKSNDLLFQEQRRMLEEQRGEHEKLRDALAAKDDELRTILRYLEDRAVAQEMAGYKDTTELRDRIEELLEEAMAPHGGVPSGGYSVFPPDFQFPEEVVSLIRVCLRILMDRLKIELYVLNRQSLHKFGLLVPAVQLRPEAQFHCFMHEMRGVVAEIAGKPQRIGGKWGIEECDVLSRLPDHRRRRAGNALNGLLIWYDHWDLSPKAEHVCYMELIRNTERVMQFARLVRQESLVNTNATSTLRFLIPGAAGAGDSTNPTESRRDPTISQSLRILEKLTSGSKRSHLARVASSKPTAGFQRSRTTASIILTPRQSELNSPRANAAPSGATPLQNPSAAAATPPAILLSSNSFARTATFTRKNTATETPGERLEDSGGKFGRRTTALVVPVSDNDIAFAASTAVARHDSAFNFNRRMSAVHLPEAETAPNRATGRPSNRFARARTDIPPSFAALADLRRPARGDEKPTPRRQSGPSTGPTPCPRTLDSGAAHKPHSTAATGGRKATASPTDSFRRTRTAFARTNTTGVPQLSSRLSGRRPIPRTSAGSRPASPKPKPNAHLPPPITSKAANTAARAVQSRPPAPSSVAPKSFYDPNVMQTLRERSKSESNRQTAQSLGKYVKSRTTSSSAATAAGLLTRPPAVSSKATVSRLSTSSGGRTPKSRLSNSNSNVAPVPVVPRLRFDAIKK